MYKISIKNTDKKIITDSKEIKDALEYRTISALEKRSRGKIRTELHLTYRRDDGSYVSTTVRAYVAKILNYNLIVFKNMNIYDYRKDNLINGRQSDVQVQVARTRTGFIGVYENKDSKVRKYKMEYSANSGKTHYAFTETARESAIIYNLLKIHDTGIKDITEYKGILNELGTYEEQLEEYRQILYKYGKTLSESRSKVRQGVKKSNKRYVGVHKRGSGYAALIQKEYKKYLSETVKTEEEAALLYNQKAIELFGNRAKLNNIQEEVE